MNTYRNFFCFPAVFVLLFCTVSALHADSIKERMRQRLPIISSLKAQGIVGENNQGYLEFKGPATQADQVAAENNDRRAVYAAIARQQKTTPQQVGTLRARQIAEIAAPGTWVQDLSGTWRQK